MIEFGSGVVVLNVSNPTKKIAVNINPGNAGNTSKVYLNNAVRLVIFSGCAHAFIINLLV